MELELNYNNDLLKLNLPDSAKVDIFNEVKIEKPLAFQSFETLFKDFQSYFNSDSILFVVNDAHRSTPTAQILKWIYDFDKTIIEKAHFMIACGTHAEPDETELKKIFGELFSFVKDRVKFHNCHDDDALTLIGYDKFEQEVSLNSELFKYEKIFIMNSVEPHYFAGFTGGRKSLVPGLADFKTIERNHNLANSLSCAPMKLSGNPMAEHLDELCKMAMKKIPALLNSLALQIVYDADKKIDSLYFGLITDAFAQAVKRAKELYSNFYDEPYDLVFMEIAPPLDRSVYQAQKALENCQMSVKDNGVGVVVSACLDGIGSKHFFELADSWDKDKNCSKDGKTHFGSHKLSRVNAIGNRITAGLYSEANKNDVAKVFYQPVEDLQKLINKLTKDNNLNRVSLIKDAAHMVMCKR